MPFSRWPEVPAHVVTVNGREFGRLGAGITAMLSVGAWEHTHFYGSEFQGSSQALKCIGKTRNSDGGRPPQRPIPLQVTGRLR